MRVINFVDKFERKVIFTIQKKKEKEKTNESMAIKRAHTQKREKKMQMNLMKNQNECEFHAR